MKINIPKVSVQVPNLDKVFQVKSPEKLAVMKYFWQWFMIMAIVVVTHVVGAIAVLITLLLIWKVGLSLLILTIPTALPALLILLHAGFFENSLYSLVDVYYYKHKEAKKNS